jgi:hypothetical protein
MNPSSIQKEKVIGGRNMSKHWMQAADKSIKKNGTKGVFKAAAEKAGKSTEEFAEEHKNDSGKLGARARLALAFMSSRKK